MSFETIRCVVHSCMFICKSCLLATNLMTTIFGFREGEYPLIVSARMILVRCVSNLNSGIFIDECQWIDFVKSQFLVPFGNCVKATNNNVLIEFSSILCN